MEEEIRAENNFRVGMVGGPLSGKTTMLLALKEYTNQYVDADGRRYSYRGRDERTVQWLENGKKELDSGQFLGATTVDQFLSLLLYRIDGPQIVLETEERPGIDYVDNMTDEMLTYLAGCDGIIVLVSARKRAEVRNSDMMEKLLTRVDLKVGGGIATGKSLPHRAAICLTQYDDPDIFNWLRGKNYLEKREVNQVKDTPILRSENVARAIREWFTDGQRIIDIALTHFKPRNVNFYALSSVGFYRKQGSSHIDWNDCCNILSTPKGECIRSAPDYHPVNLLAPLAWMISSEKAGR